MAPLIFHLRFREAELSDSCFGPLIPGKDLPEPTGLYSVEE
jgi:hypothetical protein